MISRNSTGALRKIHPTVHHNLSASYVEISNHIRNPRLRSVSRKISFCQYLGTPTFQRRSIHTQGSPNQQSSEASSSLAILAKYKASLSIPAATAQLQRTYDGFIKEGEEVIVHGYLSSRWTQSKRLFFMNLFDEDLVHSIQVVWNKPKGNLTDFESSVHELVKSIEPNSPVAVRGIARKRQNEGQNVLQSIKDLELELQEVYALNEFPKDIIATPETIFPPEQRYLQLRFDESARATLRFRSEAMSICRDELAAQSIAFVEIETPLLFKSTPEGAREFIVPTRRKGYAYALPQSPQQYKQILMASGMPRYYQFAKCFRDEDMRADRQPEFTQLDLEMSFARAEDVMKCTEAIIRRLWSQLLLIDFDNESFPRMTYSEAMSKYGSDKPDVRIGMEISRVDYLLPADMIGKITHLADPYVEMMKMSLSEDPKETLEFISAFMDSPEGEEFLKNPDGGPGIFVFDSGKPLQGLQSLGFEAAEVIGENLEDGDLVILQARKNSPFSSGSTALGNLRRALHKAAVRKDLLPAPEGFDFRWITDFPLFSPVNDAEPGQGGRAGIASTHHPFTSPKEAADVDLLLSDPLEVIGDHYDLVVNGVELGGGSRRIHQAAMQQLVLKEVLKIPEERLSQFTHLLEALRAGCPPHAGIALGFDRLIAVMLEKESVRDVIAFPKSGKGEDVMVRSPGLISQDILETYNLRLKE